MKSTKNEGLKIFLAFLAIVSLIFSLLFSFSSLTGYISSEEVNFQANIWAGVLFLIGVITAWIFLRRK